MDACEEFEVGVDIPAAAVVAVDVDALQAALGKESALHAHYFVGGC